ncbi:MAG: ABC transporter permease [Promethearchaeota archaeon]
MEQKYLIEIEEEEIEEESVLLTVLKWLVKNLKFIAVPTSTYEELMLKEQEYEKTKSQRRFIRKLKSVLTLFGLVIILGLITIAVFPHWIAPYTFEEAMGLYTNPFAAPSPAHIMGTTQLGRDVYTRLLFGARSSLTVSLPAISLSVIGGVFFGVIAAYYGGWVDSVIMRIADVFLAFPGLILALVFVGVFGREIEIIMMIYGFLGIPFYSRLIRGNVLQAKELPYVQAAKVAGSGNLRIMFRHILPNVIQPVIINVTFAIGGFILGLAGLAFLGFSDPTFIEWGMDINNARDMLYSSPWASIYPGLMIVITVLGFMLVGDGLRDALDPRLKNL